VRARGFRAAARARGLSQGAISQHIAALEALLGAKLITRRRDGSIPTAAGLALAPHAESLLRVNGRAIAAVHAEHATIGASSNIGVYLLPPYVKSFMDAHPEEPRVEMTIHSNPVIVGKLDAGEIDVAAMEWWDHRPGYVARVWRREELVVIVAPNHPWSGLPFVSKTMLRDAVILGGEPGTGTGRLLARYLGELAPYVRTHMRLESTEAVKRWVRAGVGVSIVLAGTVVEECARGMLRAIPLEGEPITKELFVIWRDSLAPQSASRRFAQQLLHLPSAGT
jgi:DNA-binding transcriptional LysR family regulator